MIKTNSLKAWLLAARPKTLTAAAVPVMIGAATAWSHTAHLQPQDHIRWVPTLLCLLFAWVMQIDSNFVNDYFDFRSGNDDETRLGPKRACAEGWVTPRAMKLAIAIATLAGCATGLPLIIYGGWTMIIVGLACVVFCFLYTTLFSYLGLGDVLVILFFGIVPVCCTYYLVLPPQLQTITPEVALASLACGLVVDTLLMVNNYRDREGDQRSHKLTLVVRIGSRNTECLYLLLGLLPALIMITLPALPMIAQPAFESRVGESGSLQTLSSVSAETNPILSTLLTAALLTVYLKMHHTTYQHMKRINHGRELNTILALTARNIFVFGLVCSLAKILSTLPLL